MRLDNELAVNLVCFLATKQAAQSAGKKAFVRVVSKDVEMVALLVV